ncbi:Short-chain dehydrogenase [Monaibacterium marinum]|uniref:Short-chain dehydrogenase n=1 Tax=Pontivivens marinum TaxID=1690039 RepID=A0A2C9CT59_9RHOB|nr:SDR family oxidoreductase [Monaibacterium marinum]SOH94447.1 Short-chain dehydrogenase [Monaibacterium marinum]
MTQEITQNLAGRIVLVTGASRGLGRGVAEVAAARGAHVVALARTVGGLEDLADVVDTLPGEITLVPLDIADDAGLQRMCLSIHERWGRVDGWVHTAIYAAPLSPAAHVAVKELDKSIAVNWRAAQRLVTMLEPLLKASDTGHAILPDDPMVGAAYHGGYGASKAAQRALWQSWQAESAQIGPKVSLHAPAPMATAVRARFHPGENRDTLADIRTEAEKLVALLQ